MKHDNNYYIMSSGCTGWNPNPTKIHKSSTIMGTYEEDCTACLNDTSNNSYGGQPTFVLPLDENKFGYKFIALFDKWNNRDLEKSNYLWLPLFIQDSKFYVDNVNINNFNVKLKNMDLIITDTSNPYYARTYQEAIKSLYNLIDNINNNIIHVESIVLNKNTLNLTVGNTQTLTYTILPDNATNKSVNWISSDETIATVDNGLVTAIKAGNAIITARSVSDSSIKAECVLNVAESSSGGSGGTGDLEGVADAVYSLGQTTFNGSSDYVDTQYQLFNTNKDFSILIDITQGTNEDAKNISLLHCMNEVAPWPGFSLKISSIKYACDYYGKGIISLFSNTSGDNNRLVITNNSSSKTLTVYTSADTSHTLTTTAFTPITQTLLIGAYKDNSGNYGRYWNGTVNEIKIWECLLTSEQIASLY